MAQFDDAFQEQLAAHYLRDDVFVQMAGSLVSPDHFQNETLAVLVSVQAEYLQRYDACCTLKTFIQVLKRMVAAKRVKIADDQELKRLLGAIWKDPLADRAFVVDTIAEFARTQALSNATIVIADALDKDDMVAINKALSVLEEAKGVGVVDGQRAVDFKATLQARLTMRVARATGTMTYGGITTGLKDLDKCLTPHSGWGRGELSILMGPPKSGKTAALLTFAKNAAEAGQNVYYASCEVSDVILTDRIDANISGVPLKEIDTRINDVDTSVSAWASSSTTGQLIVEHFPIRTLKVTDLKRILKRFESQGIVFDLVVVDYGDILSPEDRTIDKRFQLSQIFQDLRAIATTMNVALLTATQTNKEGTKKAARNVTDGTDVAEDYEKVRTADVLITINATPEDRSNGQVVLYFSEMRNAESGLRLRYSQDITCMRFLIDFLGYDT
jgi:replicative DNA helicase